MKDHLISIRNGIIKFLYKNIIRRIFFLMDAEKTHDFFIKTGKVLGSNFLTRGLTKFLFGYSNKTLQQEVLGIKFKNPIGLAAGFDKDAEIIEICPSTGFGYTEIGSITANSCKGNAKPRLWRLKKSQAIVVNYGLKNKGSKFLSNKLKNSKFSLPVGISIAKTNCKETADVETGIKDYVQTYKDFSEIGDYVTINISCPNAFGGEPFTDPRKLEKLLTQIDKLPKHKPIFIKIAPDLAKETLDEIIKVVGEHQIDGFVCTNLSKDRTKVKLKEDQVPGPGSISGKPMKNLSNQTISYLYKKTRGKYIIIGCGGIFTAQDAYEKILLGASLLQLITGMIYEGPQVISEINRGLVDLLKKDGYSNIKEAIGQK